MSPKQPRQSSHPSPAPVTIREVAKLAGVSTATVSRVLSGQLVVSDALANRVHAAVKDLSYQPNRTTRRHRKTPNKIIGLIAADIHSPLFQGMIAGITSVLDAEDCTLMICDSGGDPQRELVHLNTLRFEGIGGIILATTNSDQAYLRAFVPTAPPLVAVDRQLTHVTVDTVRVDYTAAAAKAVQTLAAAGRKHIALLDGPALTSAIRERRAGYESGLAAAGLAPVAELVEAAVAEPVEAAVAEPVEAPVAEPVEVPVAEPVEAEQLFALHPAPDAILTGSAQLAVEVLSLLHQRNLRAPKDVTVVSFEQLQEPLAGLLPIQAIAPDAFAMGAAAARLVLERAAHRRMPAREVLLETSENLA